MQPQALPGFRDFYPEDFALRAHIFDAMRRVSRRYGFEEYDGPPLEPLELYTDKSGEEIVAQLYSFTDKGGRAVALRPEMTPTLARMVAVRANGLKKPIRWFSIPQLFRYERQQRGRLREHFQLNCDLVGEPGALGDAEIIALAIDVMRALGLSAADVRVRLSDRRILEALAPSWGLPVDQLPTVYRAIDKLGRSEYTGNQQKLLEITGSQAYVEFVEKQRHARTWTDLQASLESTPAALAAAKPLHDVLEALGAMGLGDFVEIDLAVVRGLAYYTGTVFELFDAKGELRAICGGGRYDDLLQRVGGVDLPALGFGMGDVVLGELLKERGLAPGVSPAAEVFLVAATPDDWPAVFRLAHELRDRSIAVEYALGHDKIAKQFKLADARQARFAVVLGPEERARGAAMVKDLRQGTQAEVPLAGVGERLLSGLGR